MELFELITELEDTINTATGVPATRRILLDKDKITSILNQIKSSLPTEISEAKEMLEMRENLINQAVLESRRIKDSAENEARSMITDSAITKEAEKRSLDIEAQASERARDTLENANFHAGRRLLEADNYAKDTLQNLHANLTSLLETIEHGLEVLVADSKEPVLDTVKSDDVVEATD
tara:strand:- start:253 stop:786 length:534 start_codon:yes stop_codon:yes gene_type:complete